MSAPLGMGPAVGEAMTVTIRECPTPGGAATPDVKKVGTSLIRAASHWTQGSSTLPTKVLTLGAPSTGV